MDKGFKWIIVFENDNIRRDLLFLIGDLKANQIFQEL